MSEPTWKDFELTAGELDQQIIMITGATGGYGGALARACAKAGATVILAGRDEDKLNALYDEVDTLGAAQPAMVAIDLARADVAEHNQIADSLQGEFGRLDALVHTAADLGILTHMQTIEPATWARVMAVNVNAPRLLTSVCMPLLQRSVQSSVVFTADQKTTAYWGAYGVSKATIIAMMQILADETSGSLSEAGTPLVSVNAVDPGPMRTSLRRRAFPGELPSEAPVPESAIGSALALISRQAPHLTGKLITPQGTVA